MCYFVRHKGLYCQITNITRVYIEKLEFPLLIFRYTDEKLLLASPGPCTVEVRDAASLSQEEFLKR